MDVVESEENEKCVCVRIDPTVYLPTYLYSCSRVYGYVYGYVYGCVCKED